MWKICCYHALGRIRRKQICISPVGVFCPRYIRRKILFGPNLRTLLTRKIHKIEISIYHEKLRKTSFYLQHEVIREFWIVFQDDGPVVAFFFCHLLPNTYV
mmetsp:Transcript_15490/g.41269  ORF Transcript_15490/g.41269 Transcript_15490/m.41269 type:complete len:101 (-) Transcript_15490:1051-1353(-)